MINGDFLRLRWVTQTAACRRRDSSSRRDKPRAQVFCESGRDVDLYPDRRFSSALRAWRRQISGLWRSTFLLTDKQLLGSRSARGPSFKKHHHAYVWGLFDTVQHMHALNQQKCRTECVMGNLWSHALDAKWPNVTFKRPSNLLRLKLGLHSTPAVREKRDMAQQIRLLSLLILSWRD